MVEENIETRVKYVYKPLMCLLLWVNLQEKERKKDKWTKMRLQAERIKLQMNTSQCVQVKANDLCRQWVSVNFNEDFIIKQT